MANEEHLAILKQGVAVWNQWRRENPEVRPDLSGFVFPDNLILRNINLSNTILESSGGSNVDFSGANLSFANLGWAEYYQAKLRGANLYRANLVCTQLDNSDLSGANLRGAFLGETNLPGAKLIGADMNGADLTATNLVSADLTNADISNCSVFGAAVWNVTIKDTKQSNLTITRNIESKVTVDNLEIAQFVYLLLHNEKLRDMIDTLTTKSVLILGRFTPERKAVLDAIRDELRQRDYIPILFDFEKPANRDLTETVMTLASLSRFVIADLSDPNSIPHELMSFARDLLSVPVKPVFCPTPEHPKPYPMLESLQRYPHVLPTYFYDTGENLIAALAEQVIAPAEQKANDMRLGMLG